MSGIFAELPDRSVLTQHYDMKGRNGIFPVNGHIHSPYSFSAFSGLEEAFIMASEEKIRVLGINDFNTTAGYGLFGSLAQKYRVFPLFNIEFMGLLENEQKNGVRINDPNNPGRIYFSGKGLNHPVSWGKSSLAKVQGIIDESHTQVRKMTEKINLIVQSLDPSMNFDFDTIKKRYTSGMVRERHLARALRELVFERITNDNGRREFFRNLYGGTEPGGDINDIAGLENEIRGRLLKSGGAAFVEEDPSAFLALEEIIRIILDGGGIPCYPVLLDDAKGNFTEFEADFESLFKKLKILGVSAVELIPGRNSAGILQEFVRFFYQRDFIVMFGTEHNTPVLDPLTVTTRGGMPLDDELEEISWKGACVVAAHQYLRSKGEPGYVSFPERVTIKEFETLGAAVISWFTDSK